MTLRELVCHPDNLELLKLACSSYSDKGGPLTALFGMRVTASPFVPKFHKRWVFPTERFVQYEPSDEPWCRYFGIGHEEEDSNRPAFFILKSTMPFVSVDPESEGVRA